MAEPGGRGVQGGALALWLMPCTVIYEWVGGTFSKSIPTRLAYLALFLGLYWLSRPGAEHARRPGFVWRWAGAAAALLLGAAIAGYAFWWLLGPRFGWPPRPSWLEGEALRLLLPLFAAWPLAIGSELAAGRWLGPRAYQRLGVLLALGFVLHFAIQVRVQGLPVFPDQSKWLWGIAGVLLTLAIAPGPFWLRLSALLAAGLALRVLGLQVWEIDPRVRDMLALVESAQDRFASGHNPYASLYAMQHGSVLPLTYLPGMWLGYGVPRLFGFDLRLFGPCMELALFAAMAWVSTRLTTQRAWAQAVLFTFAAVWLFSPSVQWNVIYAEPSWWWCLLGATLLFSFAGPYWLGALLLGLAVATRHFAIVLAPFVLLYFVRVRGVRGSLPLLAIASGTAGLLLFGFAVGAPELFWFGTLRWLREYGPAHLTWFLDRFGFLSLFVEHDAVGALPYVQAGLVVLCLIGAFFVRTTRIASFAATASLLFIMFNVLLWDSFLLDGAMAAASLFIGWPLRAEPARSEPSSRAFYVSISVLVLTVLAGMYLGFTLFTTLRPSGRKAAHDFLVHEVKPGDLVVDRSDRHIAFVEGSWLVRREEVPAPIGGELYDGAWGGRSPLGSKLWLVTQARRDHALRATFAKLGTEREAKAFGDYRVQAISSAAPRPVELTTGRARVCHLGASALPMRGLVVKRGRPVTLPIEGEGRLLLAAGFPNEVVVWPHLSAQVGAFEIPNLHGVSVTTFDVKGKTTLTLSTDDPKPRELCVDLSWL
ncbi:MAG TPA: hypothetical protein VFX59_20615 [Polyangiales bacterium]|nr:hypothetical protein [Polyangiales bacterium]